MQHAFLQDVSQPAIGSIKSEGIKEGNNDGSTTDSFQFSQRLQPGGGFREVVKQAVANDGIKMIFSSRRGAGLARRRKGVPVYFTARLTTVTASASL